MRLHSISAGDVVRAFRLLEARDDETRAAIARVLGFDVVGDREVEAVPASKGRQHPSDEPLFNPQWTRAMISTLARIRTRSGPPEIESLVAAAGERQPMLSLALSITETASGADVLVDVGEQMAVFSREQARLVHMMRRVLGRGMVSTFRFAVTPFRGVMGEASSGVEAYRPARPGWPVIVLADLAGGPASEWLEFSRLVRSGGCHVVALVPDAPSRWPVELASSMRIIPWSRATTVRSIKSALRGLERHAR